MTTTRPAQQLLQGLRSQWQNWSPRERSLVLSATALVLLALLWWLGLAPALRALRTGAAQQDSLDAQLQHMQQLQQQARALQNRPIPSYDEAARALEASIPSLGPGARLSMSGERATVTLKNVPASALGPWLAQARINARALPTEAHLVRSPAALTPTAPTAAPSGLAPGGGASPAAAVALASTGKPSSNWDGTLVLALPSR
jgi:general secretion pathway protein M